MVKYYDSTHTGEEVDEAVDNYAEKTGTYPDMTVGTADYATEAGSANQAKEDDEGNHIPDTYATKAEIAGMVSSVNGETGDVVLTADDIYATNSQTIQHNLERIDSEVEDVIDDVDNLTTVVSNKLGFREDI